MIIQSEKVWFGSNFYPAQLEIKEGKIYAVLKYNQKPVDVDYGSKRIIPGLIDVHTHGAYGYDHNDADPEQLKHWLKNIPREGVTACLPTTVTQSEEVLTAAVKNIADVYKEKPEGAEILGIHMEGPYLCKKYKGAQPEQHITKPNIDQFKRWQTAANGLIKYMTVATEHDKDLKFTKFLAEQDVIVSMGHSNATFDEAQLSYMNGARSMTHVYNAMSPLHHREPGLVGAALNMQHMYGEIITDTIHVHPAVIQSFYHAKGKDKAIMITDSLNAKCGKTGVQYLLGNNKIELYDDGSAHLVEGGNLAGSTLSMSTGLKNLVEKAFVPFTDALNSCTINPANLLGIADRKGTLQAGKDADIVVLDDDFTVLQTYCLGKAMIE